MVAHALFDRLVGLLGKRSDAPEVVAFHEEQRLGAPPIAWRGDLSYEARHPDAGYRVSYQSELRRDGMYPLRKEEGLPVTFVASALLRPEFEGEFGDGLSTALKRKAAKKRAVAKWKTPIFRGYVVERWSDHEVVFVYDRDDKSLREVRVRLRELAEDSEEFQAMQRAEEDRKRAAPRRAVVATAGPAEAQPFGAALAALAEYQDEHGFGDVDFELYERYEIGGPTAWTGNAEAEREFWVFGGDGSGGLAASWLVHEGQPVEAQPVVFLGSEGEVGAVAKDLCDFLHLLAAGIGPYEAVAYGLGEAEAPLPGVARLADARLQVRAGRTARDVAAAASAYDDIALRVADLNQH
ncbi:MAG: hypothetical protein AAF721_35245 [Myxococcota bacterium]